MMGLQAITDFFTGNKANNTATETRVVSPEVYRRKQMYEMVMNTRQYVGAKEFGFIPLELLEIDDTYQRMDCINLEKVYDLVNHFDKNKFDPIQVSPHPETYSFAVTNGAHRMMATQIRKETGCEAVIVTGLSENPDERRIQEATLFATQNDQVDNLSVSQKHKANVLRGIRKHVILDECIRERKILIDSKILKNMESEKRDQMGEYRVLSGYTAALSVAAFANGKDVLTHVLNVIELTSWRNAAGGYSSDIIRTLGWIINLHDCDQKTINAIIAYLTPMEPKEFVSRAYAKYPARRQKERLCMLLEKEVAKILKQKPLYEGGDMRRLNHGAKSKAKTVTKTA